jgi:hypothetical protein
MCRVWAMMSPTPTIRPFSSVAVVPDRNTRLPTRTPGENVKDFGQDAVGTIGS